MSSQDKAADSPASTGKTGDVVFKTIAYAAGILILVALAAVFFAMFFPYASGLLTPTWWMDWLKWFPKIYY